jgi:hypothetical protein
MDKKGNPLILGIIMICLLLILIVALVIVPFISNLGKPEMRDLVNENSKDYILIEKRNETNYSLTYYDHVQRKNTTYNSSTESAISLHLSIGFTMNAINKIQYDNGITQLDCFCKEVEN